MTAILLVCSSDEPGHVKTGGPKRFARVCSDRSAEKGSTVFPWWKPFWMLNIPLTIGDLHCRSRALCVLNKDGVSLAIDFAHRICASCILGCEAAGELLREISDAEGAHHGGCST